MHSSKKAAKEGYFEELIRKYLLDNPFEAVITVSPKRGLTAIEDEKLREKLEAYKKSWARRRFRRSWMARKS